LAQDTLSRSLHDVGLAAWFGGTLANAVALNPASAEADTAEGTGRVANTGWNRWTPINAAAIGAHLAGSIGKLVGNRTRLIAQRGVGAGGHRARREHAGRRRGGAVAAVRAAGCRTGADRCADRGQLAGWLAAAAQ
jgi:hypothetical protein